VFVGSMIFLAIKPRDDGSIWFIPIVLVILWLAAYLDTLPGVLLSLVLGVIATYLIWGPAGGYPEQNTLPTPFAVATIVGMYGILGIL
jgi:hypothetical protein